MHESSNWHMQDSAQRYLFQIKPKGAVLDVGSRIGSEGAGARYREIFETAGWTYHGLDLAPGSNVDIVAKDPFSWPIENEKYDAVVSGQMMEHNSMFWLTFLEMARVLKPEGHMIHIAPSRGPEHKAPTDCWRFYRDGMGALAQWAGLRLLEATTDWSNKDLDHMVKVRPGRYSVLAQDRRYADERWGDTVGIFVKPTAWSPEIATRYMRLYLRKLAGEERGQSSRA